MNTTENIPDWRPDSLENELVKLIPLQKAHFDALYEVASDPAIWELHPAPNRYQKPEFKSFFDAAINSKTAFLIVDQLSKSIIGSTRFYDFKPFESVGIGYTFLGKAYWGGQYNGSVKQLMLNYAFDYVDRVYFHIGENNIISQKAIQKLGASKFRAFEFESNGKLLPYVECYIEKENWALRLK